MSEFMVIEGKSLSEVVRATTNEGFLIYQFFVAVSQSQNTFSEFISCLLRWPCLVKSVI